MKRPLALLLLSFAISSVAFANPSGYLMVLVPLNPGSVSGAFGTLWTTTLWASNGSDADLRIRCLSPSDSDCVALNAHSTIQVASPGVEAQHGFFMLVRSGFPPAQVVPENGIAFDLRVTDSSTAPHSAGVEIPLVRPSDFASLVLLSPVPLNGHSRLKLRIYGGSRGEGAVQATVHAMGATTNRDVMTTTVTLQGGDRTFPPRFPSYAELNLPVSSAGDDALRLEIASSGAVWAFVSVTDDVSQEVTIVTPQPTQYVPISVA